MNILQDVYKFVNFTIGEPPFPLNKLNTTAVFNMRFVGIVEGRKNGVFISNLWFRGGQLAN